MKRIAKDLIKAGYRALGYYPTTIHGMKFRCDPYHVGFWRNVSKGRWEPETYDILSRYLERDSAYCDIGSWIGPTVIYAARRCARVVCFEPDPFAYEYLLWNIRLNGLQNVTPFNIALANGDGTRTLASFGSDLGDSQSSLLTPLRAERTAEALCMTWETWRRFSGQEKFDFMKIDVEGSEFDFLPTIGDYLATHKPIVYLSTHAPYLDVEKRKEAMRGVIRVMEIYGACLDEKLERVELEDLAADAVLDRFRSFLFVA